MVSQVALFGAAVTGFCAVLPVEIGEFLSCKQEIRSRNENNKDPIFFMNLPDLINNFTFYLNRFGDFRENNFRDIYFVIY